MPNPSKYDKKGHYGRSGEPISLAVQNFVHGLLCETRQVNGIKWVLISNLFRDRDRAISDQCKNTCVYPKKFVEWLR